MRLILLALVHLNSRRDNKFGLWPRGSFLRVDYIVNLDSIF